MENETEKEIDVWIKIHEEKRINVMEKMREYMEIKHDIIANPQKLLNNAIVVLEFFKECYNQTELETAIQTLIEWM